MEVVVWTFALVFSILSRCHVPSAPAPRYMFVDELVAGGVERYEDHSVLVHGWVVPGSFGRDGFAFMISKQAHQLAVAYGGPLPAVLKDASEVVIRGHVEHGVLVAREIDTRCARRYDEAVARRRELRYE